MQVLPPHLEHQLIHFRPTFLHWQFCMQAQAVFQPQLSICMLKSYVHDSQRMAEASKGWLWVWDSEKLMRSIETSMFYSNASNYHLIDVVIPSDTRLGHMVFLTKLTDRGSSNLSFKDMHWFNMTQSCKHDTIPQCIWKPCRHHSYRRPMCTWGILVIFGGHLGFGIKMTPLPTNKNRNMISTPETDSLP